MRAMSTLLLLNSVLNQTFVLKLNQNGFWHITDITIFDLNVCFAFDSVVMREVV